MSALAVRHPNIGLSAFCGPIPACTLEVVHVSYWHEAAKCELSQMN